MLSAIALGSNVGNRLNNIKRAIELLSKYVEIIKISNIYETEPWGYTEQDTFLNACVLINTELEPYELLKICKNIEKDLKRKQRFKWGPREIDLDIIYYGDLVLEKDDLNIPHKHMFERDFVIVPLNDISPDWKHPIFNKTIKERYDEIDKSKIKRYEKES
ncbi:2-amino-4-hydroxy-6-hydroxymethyldihydropteridine diphosphokinase [Marinitoga aeolica]|uniref:2-amino-4-hydroxy-6-hydroxymethyldihydropteridine diphosphokinase n=1 Tax=Marinitoga aeolica TaxID=2809031 RepID=A0ABY8PU20_9BACT|nr:2-amino-4-hydroxy-6-hydroxymethyldihydropteridine diphosphokinase [Marinitoga aeolica]WGS66107.1 2-amino-4-hydroxy-6-hydroxymethyldihydropteridine diphosphokinase [Marinitoga aeolica]